MPIPKTSLKQFQDHLEALGLSRGMNIAIHSNMVSFGRLEGGLDSAYSVIRRMIGESATVVVPTYTPKLSPDSAFNPDKTLPQSMGVLSNFMMHRERSVRTVTPIHSHAIEGPLKRKLCAADHNISMGPGSIFQAMQDEGFYLLLLGSNFQQGATFVHHVEACTGVYYREWLELKRKVVQADGAVKDFKLRYYGRNQESGLKTNLNLLQNKLEASGFCTKVSIKQSASYLMNLLDLFDVTQQLIISQPNIMMVPESNE
jgi:aminoglycoside N3'-acetyltransferase